MGSCPVFKINVFLVSVLHSSRTSSAVFSCIFRMTSYELSDLVFIAVHSFPNSFYLYGTICISGSSGSTSRLCAYLGRWCSVAEAVLQYDVAVVTPCPNSVESSCRKPEECMVGSYLMQVHDYPSFQRLEIKLWNSLAVYAVLTYSHLHLISTLHTFHTSFVRNILLKSTLSFLLSATTSEFSFGPLSFLTSILHFTNSSSCCLLFISWFAVVSIRKSFHLSLFAVTYSSTESEWVLKQSDPFGKSNELLTFSFQLKCAVQVFLLLVISLMKATEGKSSL